MNNRNLDNYYTFEQVRDALGLGTRTVRGLLTGVSPSLVRSVSDGPGRPRNYYHFASHPRLTAYHEMKNAEPESTDEQTAPIAPDDIATATLRLRVVKQYEALRKLITESEAARQVVRDWKKRPHQETVRIDERLPGGIVRQSVKRVTLDKISVSSIRRWASLYRKEQRVTDLAPNRKGNAGRKREEIPDELLDLVHVFYANGERVDMERALELAKPHWPGDFPELSTATWRRRILERDPDKSSVTLGTRGIAAFRQKHSPDITRNYLNLRYNQLWQLDDVTEDFYGHASDPLKLIRPYAYLVLRVATRQWICVVTCEAPITQDMVRPLVGMAMASPSGGVPEDIMFERGTVACDKYLEDLLTDMGVTVHRTSMDGGRVHDRAFPDKATGHAAGKGVIEGQMRTHHNDLCMVPGQTGADERRTAHANLETIKAESLDRALSLIIFIYVHEHAYCRLPEIVRHVARHTNKRGKRAEVASHVQRLMDDGYLGHKDGTFFTTSDLKPEDKLILPTPAQWRGLIYEALEKHNNSPHTGLPEIVTSEGKRHMTPNEYAEQLKDQEVKVMDEKLLPVFFEKGFDVPVTKNGFRLHNFTYGRFDDDVQELAGQTVEVFGIKEHPDMVYVPKLGRCVERYEAPDYGCEGGLIEKKTHIEKRPRNQYEELVAGTTGKGAITTKSVHFMRDPVPTRTRTSYAPDVLVDRVDSIDRGVKQEQDRRAALDSRFDVDATTPQGRRPRSSGRRGKSLLAKAKSLGDTLATQDNSEDEEWA